MSTPFYDLASLVVVPSGYKASKVYAQKPLTTDGQLTFSRASTATRVNASGLIETVSSNVPRLDYLGSTCPKLQLEPQRSNVVVGSQDIGGTPWQLYFGTRVANTTETLDPAGANGAVKITMGSGNQAVIRQSIGGLTNGATYTLSLYIKQGSGVTAFLDISDTTSTVDITPTSQWVRYTKTGVWSTTNNFIDLEFRGTDGSAYCYIYGCQLEAGAYPTSLIPTTTAAVTRLADVATKTGVSSLIGATAGTMYAEFTVSGFANFGTPLCINDGTTQESVWLTTFGNGDIRAEVFSAASGGIQATFTKTGNVVGQTYKIAIAYAQHNTAFFVNGVQVGATDTSCNVPVGMSRVDFDYTNASLFVQSALNIKQALLFKTRLSNADLAALTA